MEPLNENFAPYLRKHNKYTQNNTGDGSDWLWHTEDDVLIQAQIKVNEEDFSIPWYDFLLMLQQRCWKDSCDYKKGNVVNIPFQ